MKMLRFGLFCAVFAISSQVHAAKLVLRCSLGANHSSSNVVELRRSHPIFHTYLYSLNVPKQGGGGSLYEGDPEDSRGQLVQAACVGKKEHILVLSGEFTSNYIQGIALRFSDNEGAGGWQRLNFAERGRPTRVYASAKGMCVVIPNFGYDSNKKYIVYRYFSDKGQQGDTQYMNHYPTNCGTYFTTVPSRQ